MRGVQSLQVICLGRVIERVNKVGRVQLFAKHAPLTGDHERRAAHERMFIRARAAETLDGQRRRQVPAGKGRTNLWRNITTKHRVSSFLAQVRRGERASRRL